MTNEYDRLEKELAALRPTEPSAELAERIGARLGADEAANGKPSPGRYPATLSQRERVFWSVPTTFWLAPAGAIAVVVLAGAVWWSTRRELPPVEMPIDVPQPTLASALDDSLPSVWTYRSALQSPGALDQLLDKHAVRPSAGGDSVQTRGFGSISMDLKTRLGEF